MLKKFIQDESGATVVEYGLIVAVLSLVILAGFRDAMHQLLANFEYASDVMQESRN